MDQLWEVSFGTPVNAFVVQLLGGMFAFFAAALIAGALRTGRRRRAIVAVAPSALATVGVTGTFLGIFLGLQQFDVAAIDDSVPSLLEGLKTAFVTSLWGMALSVAYRLLATLLPPAASPVANPDQALATLVEETRLARTSTVEALEALQRAVAGDADGTLVSQLTLLRSDTRDGLRKLEEGLGTRLHTLGIDAHAQHEELIGEFRAFADHMVENTHGALIEALGAVIRDFNDQLTEQFGENFKALNASVELLVDWQERYREHIDATEARLARALAAVDAGADSLERIESSTRAIPPALEPLGATLAITAAAMEHMDRDLEAYADLHDKAREALPKVNANIEALTTRMAEMAEQSAAAAKARTDEVERRLSEQYTDLDDKLRDELGRALKTMSDNLGSMSAEFVKDYGPLTQELGRIVRLAEAANAPDNALRARS